MWARIRYEYKTGEALEVEVGTDSLPYPDALSEVVSEVIRMWETVGAE